MEVEGELVDRLEACGAVVGDGHIVEVAAHMDHETHGDFIAGAEGVGTYDALFDAQVVGA